MSPGTSLLVSHILLVGFFLISKIKFSKNQNFSIILRKLLQQCFFFSEMTSNEDVSSRHVTKVKKSTVSDATSSTSGGSKSKTGRSPRKSISFASSKFWLRLVRPWKWRNLRRKVRRSVQKYAPQIEFTVFDFINCVKKYNFSIDFSEVTASVHHLKIVQIRFQIFQELLLHYQNCLQL